MRFLILGPLVIEDTDWNGEMVPLRERTVLAMLLLQPNVVVPVDHIVDAVWGDSPPRTARSQIQICVSQLRRRFTAAGAGDVISTRAPGYMCRIENGELDLDIFNRYVECGRDAVENADLEEATRQLRSALSLWRGDVLADINSEKVASAGQYLAERRMAVTEDWLDVELRLGRHHQVIGELQGLIHRHPFRERLRAQLMVALYRAGRQAEALDLFHRTRQMLDDELGLAPGSELRELERAILTADPALMPEHGSAPRAEVVVPAPAAELVTPRAVPRLLPSTVGDFTGRTQQLALMRQRLVTAVERGDVDGLAPAVEVISGKGGVGKTAIAVHLSHQLSHHYRDGQLYARLRDGVHQPIPVGQVLETFLRALGVAGESMPREVEARAAMYRDLMAGRKILVLLDDAVDDQQVLALLPGTESCSVVVTSRSRLTGVPGAHQTVLREFDGTESLEFVGRILGDDSREFTVAQISALTRACGGLPLALRIAAARLSGHPHWTIRQLTRRLADPARGLDELAHGSLNVRESIALSCEHLSDRARSLFRRLSLVEVPDFAGWVAAGLEGVGIGVAEDLLDLLVGAHLIEVTTPPGGAPRYRLDDLTRCYAREQLAATDSRADRAAALRRLVGACAFLAGEAHRREYGGAHPTLGAAVRPVAFETAEVEGLDPDPLEWLERESPVLRFAVLQACGLEEAGMAWSVAVPMITSRESRCGVDEGQELRETVPEATGATEEDLGTAEMLYCLGTMDRHEGASATAESMLHEARRIFAENHNDLGVALARRHIAHIERGRGNLDTALADYRSALRTFRELGDLVGQGHVLNRMARVRMAQGRGDEAAELLGRAMDCVAPTGSRRLKAGILHRMGELDLRRGHHESAAVCFNSALAEVRLAGDRLGEAHVLHGLGSVQARQRNAEAQNTLTRALALSNGSARPFLSARILVTLADVHCGQGKCSTAAGELIEAFSTFVEVDATSRQVEVLEKLKSIRPNRFDREQVSLLCGRVLAILPQDAPGEVRRRARELMSAVDHSGGSGPGLRATG